MTLTLNCLRALLVLTAVTGVVYPLLVTTIAQVAFPHQANGSRISVGGVLVGSELFSQKFTDPKFFWPRPSAADFATVASGASNQGFTSKKLADAVVERSRILGGTPAPDLLYASGSGLDPHISFEALQFQIPRVAEARGMSIGELKKITAEFIEKPQLGFLGQHRVNVLRLNLALEANSKR